MKYIFSDYEILVNVTLSKIKASDDVIILDEISNEFDKQIFFLFKNMVVYIEFLEEIWVDI